MAQQVDDNAKFTGVRLPQNLVPLHYDLSLKPDLKQFTFEGTVKISYKADATVQNEVLLHSHELVIEKGYAASENPLVKVTYSKDTETATLQFERKLDPSGHLFLNFRGILNDKLKGFYRSEFKVQEQTVYAATTQFEATDARRCFPCWDEPAIKATFGVTLDYPKTLKLPNGEEFPMVGLSNMPVESQQCQGGDIVTTTFQPTPKMSTYLLAFVIGPFECIEGSDGKREIKVFTTPGKSEQGRFALDVACKSLPYYEQYFGIDYPLKKMDLIAIPDFAAGAMENWGLVTYRETCLLVDPKNTATTNKQYVALVVAHELAHQWFGNLVTMEWWTHLWLNEGFATFMEFLCVDHIFPEWDIWSQFVTQSYCRALELDSLHNSHPIEVPVKHPSEIDEIFDDISYNKGSCVIRMLYNYIGDDCFRKGMKNYLNKYAYSNAATENLWESLEAASGKPVYKLMTGWTSQKGFPWLSVSCSTEGGKTQLTLTQQKFTANGFVPEDEVNTSWVIPVATITGSDPAKPADSGLIEGKTGVVTVEGAGDSWIKLNPGTIGLYRTAYPEEMAKKLWPAILDQTLPPMDRLGMQNDCFALCQSGKVSTVDLLKLLEAFRGETNYTVWSSIDSCLGRLNILLSYTDYQDKFHSFGRNLYSEIFKKLTWSPRDGENDTDAMTRALVINRLVSFGDKNVIEESMSRYKAHIDGSHPIPADLRGAVYRAVSVHGDDAAFEGLFEIYKTAALHEEKDRAARALGFTKDSARLKRVLEFVLSDEVRNQDKVFVIMTIGVNNPPVAWKFLQDHKDMLRVKYESGFLVARMIKFSTENFASEEKAQEIEKFFEENKFPGAERTVQQSLETVRLNAGWLARDSQSVRAFLSS